MNQSTNLNSELLAADARGRKHIPFAVFAVILIHIILFVLLLIAAGCRAKARARHNVEGSPQMVQQETFVTPSAAAAPATNAAPKISLSQEPVSAEPVMQAEEKPAIEKPGRLQESKRTAVARAVTSARSKAGAKYYVVQAGDTVEKIARQHRTTIRALKMENRLKNDLLRPGQKIRIVSSKAEKDGSNKEV